VKPFDVMVNNMYSLFQHSVALYIGKTGKIRIVVKKVKQGVFVLLNAVHIYPVGWVKLCVVGGMDFIFF
jgi:hypothetical protein